MKRMFAAVLVLGALAIGPVLAAAQAPAPGRGAGGQGGANPAAQAAPTNLQVMPKDTSRADVVAAMRGFTGALGVQCAFCHVMEGRGGRNDMASDEKKEKGTARVMMRMTASINQQLAPLGNNVEKVECGTCHRGAAEPPEFVPPPPPAGGAGAAPGGGAPPAPGR